MITEGNIGRVRFEDTFLIEATAFQEKFPVGAISLTNIARAIGCSRERVRQLYWSTKNNVPLPPLRAGWHQVLPEEYRTSLDAAVSEHLKNQESIRDIARRVSVPQGWVEMAQRRIKATQIEKRRTLIRSEILEKRPRGIGNIEIVHGLEGVYLWQVDSEVRELVKEGKVNKLRNRIPKKEIPEMDARVKELRNGSPRLSTEEIAGALQVTVGRVMSSVRRQILNGQIESRTRDHKPEFYLPIQALAEQNFRQVEIADLLHLGKSQVQRANYRLRERGIIVFCPTD